MMRAQHSKYSIPNPQDPFQGVFQISNNFYNPYPGSLVIVKVGSRPGWNTFN